MSKIMDKFKELLTWVPGPRVQFCMIAFCSWMILYVIPNFLPSYLTAMYLLYDGPSDANNVDVPVPENDEVFDDIPDEGLFAYACEILEMVVIVLLTSYGVEKMREVLTDKGGYSDVIQDELKEKHELDEHKRRLDELIDEMDDEDEPPHEETAFASAMGRDGWALKIKELQNIFEESRIVDEECGSFAP